jgi:hypothetical protein
VTANFVATYTLNISASDPNGGTFTGAGTYAAGTVVTISETPNSDYRAAGWGGPDSGSTASSSSATTTIVINANATLVADFVQQVTLTVSSDPNGTATGSGTYDIGSTVTITAAPNTGYGFNDWTEGSPDNPPASAGQASTTVTLNSDQSIEATFAPLPPSAVITAATTAYTGSPFNVASTATAPASDLEYHTIEWLSPSGDWTVNSADVSGGTSNRTLGINFDTTGVWTLRAGASIDGTTWVYSPNVQVTVSNGFANYTLETMAVPVPTALNWYASSPVVQKTYTVQHVNPTNPGP